MQFKVQYWLHSDLVDMPVTETVFPDTTQLWDWLKVKLKDGDFDTYNWTVLLDKSDVGEGHYTILHNQMAMEDLEADIEKSPKYKNWVKAFTKDFKDKLKAEKLDKKIKQK